MRLAVLERGGTWRRRIRLRIGRLLGRPEPNPVTKTVWYRPELFGRHWLQLVRSVMQGPSDWSAGERELLGAFVSGLNSCPFCAGFHEAAAVELLGPEVAADSLGHGSARASNPRLEATRVLLRKVTLTPDRVDRDDVDAVRAAGVSDPAIVDALYLCLVFNAVNRIVNALDDG